MNIDKDKLIEQMVNRFLGWKLPKDFNPDANINFYRQYEHESPHYPVGTNLFTAAQAKAMIEHMLEGAITSMQTEQPAELKSLISSAESLLELDRKGALVPIGVCGLARTIIERFIKYNSIPAPVTSMQESISEKCTSEPKGYLQPNGEFWHIGAIKELGIDVSKWLPLFDHDRVKGVSDEPIAKIALENAAFQKRIAELEDLLSSAYNIANRNGENTHWERFAGQLHVNGIIPVTPKTFKILPSDIEYSQLSTNTDSAQLYEIFSSIEECPPILESDSFIVKRVKEMAQLINSLSTQDDVDEALEKAAKICDDLNNKRKWDNNDFANGALACASEIRALIKRE